MNNQVMIVVTLDGRLLQQYSFDQPKLFVGRKSDCDIVLDNPGVSRVHAEIANENGETFVSDLDSSNGTLVNGEKVRRVRLRDGDRVTVGKFELHVALPREYSGASDESRLYERDRTISAKTGSERERR